MFFRNVYKMQQLNFPHFEFKLVRHKFVTLTPEEWVRQHLIAYLTVFKGYPASVIGVEKQLLLNKMPKRFDLVVFKRNGNPLLLVECKAPGVEITEKAFDQAARYNMLLKAEYFLITNGIDHFPCRLDYEHKQYVFIKEVPDFDEVRGLNS
jgi:hypothetical protein